MIVGSGIAGAFAAYAASRRGRSVAVIEQGPRLNAATIRRIWEAGSFNRYAPLAHIPVQKLGQRTRVVKRLPTVTGGLASFYASVSMRMRESEFAHWPFPYDALEPWYAEAETAMGVAGETGTDPTEPHRSRPLTQSDPGLSLAAHRLRAAAESLGLHPFRHPLAIRFSRCRRCATCNQVPCPFGAKFSPQGLLDGLRDQSVTVYDRHTALRINTTRGPGPIRVTSVEARRQSDGQTVTFKGSTYILCGGAIQTPLLLYRSGLNHGRSEIGANAMTHCLGNVVGFFPFPINTNDDFEKWLSVADYYFDDDGSVRGLIQQDQLSPLSRVLANAPGWLRPLIGRYYPHAYQLLAIAEDEPVRDNRVHPFPNGTIRLTKRFTRRDLRKRRYLTNKARQILKAAGALFTIAVPGQSVYHTCGTCRMGTDPEHSVTDPNGRLWHTSNLYVGDASLMPTSSGVNPSLTIAANALRVAAHVT